jgi:hypothetical protein
LNSGVAFVVVVAAPVVVRVVLSGPALVAGTFADADVVDAVVEVTEGIMRRVNPNLTLRLTIARDLGQR